MAKKATVPKPTLKAGSGDTKAVYWLQEIMKEHGWYKKPKDGVFGPATADAVARMQEDLGVIPATKIYNVVTAAKLIKFLKKQKK